ncbi:hypothetical protein ACFP81_12415 [Deinococcus lacus]|uniref:Protein kinase domain-containing protein n=1 Tax=Deinococcus lacus TaxID=392561 RepID=A0ABW1YEI4_9DEIO
MSERLAPSLVPGTVLQGKYQIVAAWPLTAGQPQGYHALHLGLGRAVTLLEEVQPAALPLAEQGRLMTRLGAEPYPEVLDSFGEAGRAYLVLPALPGAPLAGSLQGRGPLTPAEGLQLAEDLLAGLGRLHSQGFLIRQLRPQDIWWSEEGKATLPWLPAAVPVALAQSAPQVGPYHAPEETTSAVPGPPADLYALGAVLYTSLTGAVPPLATERLLGATLQPPPPGTPAALERLVDRLLRLRPEERPQTAAQAEAELLKEPAQTVPPVATPAPSPAPEPVHLPTRPAPAQIIPPNQSQPRRAGWSGPGCWAQRC